MRLRSRFFDGYVTVGITHINSFAFEHVRINEGGQAIIGNVKPDRSSASGSPERSASGGV
jgi:hypothetical protein